MTKELEIIGSGVGVGKSKMMEEPTLLTIHQIQQIQTADIGFTIMTWRNNWNSLIGMFTVERNLHKLKTFHPDLGSTATMVEAMNLEISMRKPLMAKSSSDEEYELFLVWYGENF